MQALDEVSGRTARGSAPHAVDFPRLARSLAPLPSVLVKSTQVGPVNEGRPSIIDSPESGLKPLAHGVRVNSEQTGDLVHPVGPVNLGEAVIRGTRTHSADPGAALSDGPTPPPHCARVALPARSRSGERAESLLPAL